MYKFEKANRLFDQRAYGNAIERYQQISTKLPQKHQIKLFQNMGSGYLELSKYRQAEQAFDRCVNRGGQGPLLTLNMGKTKQGLAKYEEAITLYSRYMQLVPGDTSIARRIMMCKLLKDSLDKITTKYVVENAEYFNSNKHEYAARFASSDYSTVYITSSKEGVKDKKSSIVTNELYSDIFFSLKSRAQEWSNVKLIPPPLSTAFADEGVVTFSSDYRTIYFTSCLTKGKIIGCRIYKATKGEGEEEWTDITEVPLFDSTINVAHPMLVDDSELYFASDAPGGYGEMDIWMATANGESWGKPQNLGGEINSPLNETYPFVRENGDLYFASNGWSGYGGLDIFRGKRNSIGGWTIENVGIPINSNADDFGIIFEGKEEKGFFTSNRENGKGGDDIYSFYLPQRTFELTIAVKTEEDNAPLGNITVRLINSLGEIQTLMTNNSGVVQCPIQGGVDYLIATNHADFFSKKARFSTKMENEDSLSSVKKELYLQSSNKTIEIPNVFYAFGSAELSPEAQNSLLELATILNDNPEITIELASHTDSRGDSTFNQRLSQTRAQRIVDFLNLHGVDIERVIPKGYGATVPRVIDAKTAKLYEFLSEGDVLNDAFIEEKVTSDEEEAIVDQLNRRTDFTVKKNP